MAKPTFVDRWQETSLVVRINLEKGADRVTQSFIWLRFFPSSREQVFIVWISPFLLKKNARRWEVDLEIVMGWTVPPDPNSYAEALPSIP